MHWLSIRFSYLNLRYLNIWDIRLGISPLKTGTTSGPDPCRPCACSHSLYEFIYHLSCYIQDFFPWCASFCLDLTSIPPPLLQSFLSLKGGFWWRPPFRIQCSKVFLLCTWSAVNLCISSQLLHVDIPLIMAEQDTNLEDSRMSLGIILFLYSLLKFPQGPWPI